MKGPRGQWEPGLWQRQLPPRFPVLQSESVKTFQDSERRHRMEGHNYKT